MSAPSSNLFQTNPVPVMIDDSQKKLLCCAVCFNVLDDPVRACNANHHFCRGCLHNVVVQHTNVMASCPECSGNITFSWDPTGTRVAGVPAPILAGIIAAQQCACPFECGNNFKLAAFPDHKKVCANAPVECPFAALGCKHTTTRGKLNQHMEDAKTEHDLLVAGNLSDTNKMMSEQCKRLQTAEHHINELKMHNVQMICTLRTGLDDVLRCCRQTEQKQAETNRILSHISRVMETNTKPFEVAVDVKRAPKRKEHWSPQFRLVVEEVEQ